MARESSANILSGLAKFSLAIQITGKLLGTVKQVRVNSPTMKTF